MTQIPIVLPGSIQDGIADRHQLIVLVKHTYPMDPMVEMGF